MRFMIKASVPVERGNELIKAGRLAPAIESILTELKPEAAYFTAVDGERTAFIIVDINEASDIPKVGEPFFLTFDGNVEFYPVMLAEDLMKAGPAIESAVERYG